MGGGNSKRQALSPEDMQQNPEKIQRLTRLLTLKSEHEQTVATKGWDKTQQEMVKISCYLVDHYVITGQFPLRLNKLPPQYIWEKLNFSSRYVRICDLDIPREK